MTEVAVGEQPASVSKIAPLLTVRDVAKALSISESATRRMMASGELKTVRIGKGSIRMTVKQLNDYIDNSMEN
jgi:excisionase family DNA binding protein